MKQAIVFLVFLVICMYVILKIDKWKSGGQPAKYLCDKCANDYDGACHNRRRPNVQKCDDYQPR
jgi:hypothetical protein